MQAETVRVPKGPQRLGQSEHPVMQSRRCWLHSQVEH